MTLDCGQVLPYLLQNASFKGLPSGARTLPLMGSSYAGTRCRALRPGACSW